VTTSWHSYVYARAQAVVITVVISRRSVTNQSAPSRDLPTQVSDGSVEWARLMSTWRLSPRERQIIECLLNYIDDETTMAQTLGISRHTVHTYIARLYQRLGVHTHCQLMVMLLTRQPDHLHDQSRPKAEAALSSR
jgi:DNA-binding CsgD family transcriptional regulator